MTYEEIYPHLEHLLVALTGRPKPELGWCDDVKKLMPLFRLWKGAEMDQAWRNMAPAKLIIAGLKLDVMHNLGGLGLAAAQVIAQAVQDGTYDELEAAWCCLYAPAGREL